MNLKAPFPWFGGKSRVASLVWERFGDVANYVEPFFGSGAVLLARPHDPRTETVNDADCYLANFWRALAADPAAVARHADWPVNEADLHARHLWLLGQHDFRERMRSEPEHYDAQIAGWWVWGLCSWIGSGWCSNAGMGVHRPSQQLPHLGDAGRGVHRPSQQLPHLGDAGRGERLRPYFEALAARLRSVRVACGDWSRVLGPSVTFRHGLTGVFLDPPYGEAEHAVEYAAGTGTVAADVRAWAAENGDNPQLRIALCGYAGEHDELEAAGWDAVRWKARGGYGSQGEGRGRDNAGREVIWCSTAGRAIRGGRSMTAAPLTPFQLRAELVASCQRRGIVPPPARKPPKVPKPAPVRGRPELPPDVVTDAAARLTFEQIAERAGVRRDSVKSHHERGAFPGAVRVQSAGKRWRWEVPLAEAEAWLAGRAAKGRAA